MAHGSLGNYYGAVSDARMLTGYNLVCDELLTCYFEETSARGDLSPF